MRGEGDIRLQSKLERLQSEYERTAGHPFAHFFCPVLFRDEDVPLCEAHIINRAFPDSSRVWTIQREDVDNFYGAFFEADFVAIQHAENLHLGDAITNKKLAKALRPKILLDGKEVEHFVAEDKIPNRFTRVLFESDGGTMNLGLKLSPEEMLAAVKQKWEISIEGDVRLPALVSLIKAAHLTLYEMLGYRYALSPAGHFVGRQILGEFFLQNSTKSKADIQENAMAFFQEFVHIIRPVDSSLLDLQGTIDDSQLLICQEDRGQPWAMIVFLRISRSLHAVLMPALDYAFAAARFITFLRDKSESIRAVLGQFQADRWRATTNSTTLHWPKTGILYP